jgi:hypothetical protein
MTKTDQNIQTVNDVISTLQGQRKLYRTIHRLEVKTNKKKWDLLSVAFSQIVKLRAGTAQERRAKIDAFKNEVSRKKDKFSKAATNATSLETRVVRYVCGNIADSTVYAWADVLKKAYKHEDVKSGATDFVTWISAAGGIDAVRRPQSKTGTGDLLQDGINFAMSAPGLWDAEEVKAPEEDADHMFSVALVRTNADGSQEIVYSSNGKSLTNATLKALARDKEFTEQLNSSDAQQDAIDARTLPVSHADAADEMKEAA